MLVLGWEPQGIAILSPTISTQSEESSWGFLARPEAGILWRIGTRRKLGLMAAAHYDFSTSKSESYGYDNFMNAGFQLGIMLMQW